jgi:hypothetical protein
MFETTTDWIAAYAAIVATFAFAWRIYEWVDSKPKIILKIKYAFAQNMPGINPNMRLICVTAMNSGHFTTTLNRTGFRLSNRRDIQKIKDWHFEKHLPYRLNPGERVDFYYEEDELKELIQSQGNGAKYKFAWVEDEADRIYKKNLSSHLKTVLR